METNEIKKEDYEEPACPFCTDQFSENPPVKPIPRSRVIEKLDEYLSRNDYSSAERHLIYWLNEAEIGHDHQGMFMICNELMGLYRKTGRKDKAFEYAEKALELSDYLDYSDAVSGGTAYVNAATVYKAFGRSDRSIPLFIKAEKIYLSRLPENDARIGGLYNNMGLAYADLGEYEKALGCYEKALVVMSNIENGEAEQAITHLNIADLIYAQNGRIISDIDIQSRLDKAEELLDTASLPRDGYYAFVCEKCAPVFGFYGRAEFEKELSERARSIYERA
ncbi:MAG: tetratricopeptide repeat protein [Clostridia bacterium]|nr:tetratricopeptide repeat protein [Clostridia bacterium]